VKRFYKYHFVDAHPPDIEIIPVSRTVGTDTIVDEMVVKFTHTCVVDHLLPGIPPTGRSVEIPVVVVGQFRDGKLASEHIYWDQASVLVQIGKLDPVGLPIAGCRDRAQGSGQGPTEQPLDGTRMAGQRGQTDLALRLRWARQLQPSPLAWYPDWRRGEAGSQCVTAHRM